MYMLNSIRNVKFMKMQKLTMFMTAVCVSFFIKLRWPKNRGLYVRVKKGIISEYFAKVSIIYKT